MIKGVIFDKDDTLIDLCKFWHMPCLKTAEYVLELCGINNGEKNIEKMMTACGFDICGKLIPGSPMQSGTNEDVINSFVNEAKALKGSLPIDIYNKAFDFFHESIFKFGKVKSVENVDMVLHRLKDKGLRLCVVTLDEYALTRYCLEQLNIYEFFDMIICADTVKNPKPAPDSAFMFCEKFGLEPDEILMVGDAQKDMIFAKRAGIHGVLYDPYDRFERSDSEFVINSMEDVLKITEQFS